jgi:membrane-bound lytic murein transglycosylase A
MITFPQNMRRIWVSAFLVLLAGCSTVSVPPEPAAPAPAAPVVTPTVPSGSIPDSAARQLQGRFVSANWSELPGWSDDDLKNVWTTFLRNCQGLMRPTSINLAGPTRATPRAWQPVCAAASDRSKAPAPNDTQAVRRFLQTWLSPWRLQGPDGKPASNIVTGYYEPLVLGSRTRTGAYQWPLYTVPTDLLTIDLGRVYPELAGKRVRGKLDGKRVVPYESRAAIETSARRPPAIVYVNDPVDNFFLQVQGSGRVQLPDGKTIRVAYADHNGHPYVSIGKWLADKGEMPIAQTSMQNIRAWAKRNPNRTQEMLNANPAMVFFAEEAITDPEIGPKGAYGIPLMAQRSVAVDTNFVPLGTLCFCRRPCPRPILR